MSYKPQSKFDKFLEHKEKELEEEKFKRQQREQFYDDEVTFLRNLRIKEDVTTQSDRKKCREEQERAKKERQDMGATAWFEREEKERKQREKEKRAIERDNRSYDQGLRKDMREIRREQLREVTKMHEEYEGTTRRWREEDERRARERAADEKREREAAWAREDTKRAALRRARQEAWNEHEDREAQKAFEKAVREREQEAKESADQWAIQEFDRAVDKKKREKERRKQQLSVQLTSPELNGEVDVVDDHYAHQIHRIKSSGDHRASRLQAADKQLDDMRHFYADRDYYRKERTRRALNDLYSPVPRKAH